MWEICLGPCWWLSLYMNKACFNVSAAPAGSPPQISLVPWPGRPETYTWRNLWQIPPIVAFVGVLVLAPTYCKHANMTYQQLVHLHCIWSSRAGEASMLAWGVPRLLQASCGGCGSVIGSTQSPPSHCFLSGEATGTNCNQSNQNVLAIILL